MDRRKFIQGVAVTTLATLASQTVLAQDSAAKLKIVVFWQDGFPPVDGLVLTREKLNTALKSHKLIFANESQLASQLTENIDVFVNPYGSAFPKKSWPAILKYLQAGGNFLNLGGVPLAVPVNNNKAETRQVNYHKRLGITQSFPIDGKEITEYAGGSLDVRKVINPSEIYEFYLKLSNVNDFPEEAGSDGRREAKVEALTFGFDKNKRCIAAPIIQIDRLQGEFAGGRWVLASFKGEIEPELIKTLAETASFGAGEVKVATESAVYRPGEKIIIKPKIFLPKSGQERYEIIAPSYALKKPDGTGSSLMVRGIWSPFNQNLDLSIDLASFAKTDQKGYYELEMRISLRSANKTGQRIIYKTGFWVLDEKLLATGEPFTADRHFLYRNNQPFPVAGTTYMSSEVARRFLLEPNPAVWDKDFQGMKAAGVNMIRTGIWTAWKLYFDEKGEVKEEVLRAFEAFMLTAKKYDIPVIFTFFAFMPEMFGGKNAYLDPKSIGGQRNFYRRLPLG